MTAVLLYIGGIIAVTAGAILYIAKDIIDFDVNKFGEENYKDESK